MTDRHVCPAVAESENCLITHFFWILPHQKKNWPISNQYALCCSFPSLFSQLMAILGIVWSRHKDLGTLLFQSVIQWITMSFSWWLWCRRPIFILYMRLSQSINVALNKPIAKFSLDCGPKSASVRINIKILSKSSRNQIVDSDW